MNEAEYVAGNPAFNGSDWMVVVSGCSGGGKSTLLAELALRGYAVFPEPGRQIVKEQLSTYDSGIWHAKFETRQTSANTCQTVWRVLENTLHMAPSVEWKWDIARVLGFVLLPLWGTAAKKGPRTC